MGLSTQGGQKMAKLVLQTDFGLVDGAVAAMYGVAYGVDGELSIHDLTHEIPPYDIIGCIKRRSIGLRGRFLFRWLILVSVAIGVALLRRR